MSLMFFRRRRRPRPPVLILAWIALGLAVAAITLGAGLSCIPLH